MMPPDVTPDQVGIVFKHHRRTHIADLDTDHRDQSCIPLLYKLSRCRSGFREPSGNSSGRGNSRTGLCLHFSVLENGSRAVIAADRITATK